MKLAIVACVVLAVGCKQGEKPGTGSGSGSGSGSAAGSGPATGSGSGSGSADGSCVIVVQIKPGTVTYDGGGIAGNVDRKPGEPPNLDVLKPFAGKCAAFVTADPTLTYQDVILVMDTLVKDGIVDVSLGKPGDPPPGHDRPAHPDHATDVTTLWKVGPDGKPLLEGTVEHRMAAADRWKTMPVLIVSKTQVLFGGKEIGKPEDSALQDELATALPANPKDPTLILQADAATSAATINQVIAAANQRGYTELLFAVKTK